MPYYLTSDECVCFRHLKMNEKKAKKRIGWRFEGGRERGVVFDTKGTFCNVAFLFCTFWFWVIHAKRIWCAVV